MTKLRLFLLLLLILLNPMNVFSQDTTTSKPNQVDYILTPKGPYKPNNRVIGSKYLYEIESIIRENAKIVMKGTNYVCQIYNDSNQLKVSYECLPIIAHGYIVLGNTGDTIDDVGDYYTKMFNDTILPKGLTVSFINWKKYGLYYEYNSSGTIVIEGRYDHDLKVGVWYYYNETGDVIRREKYKKGKIVWSRI